MTWYIWLILFLVFLGLEIMTTGIFFFLCFATGALFAMLFFFFFSAFQTELIIFCAISLCSILLIRPIFKKYFSKRTIETNVDSLINSSAIVTEEIKPASAGKIKIEGEVWLAVSEENIAVGETVIIQSVDGTKLHVKKK